jgi:hypothetical protein
MPRGKYDRKKAAKKRSPNLTGVKVGDVVPKVNELPVRLLDKAERLLDAIADDGNNSELSAAAIEVVAECIRDFRIALKDRNLIPYN